ncbi:MAG TPA: Ig-like domain-containing protein [Anaerolineaceae bacterium]|nr:Ig-like domain-containing protein [Anaerolineaceae bacterium]
MSKLALILPLLLQLVALRPVAVAWPVAHPDQYGTRPGEPLLVAAPGILENDELPIPVSIVLSAPPGHGRLELDDADGSFGYTPDPGFSGQDSFTYRLVWEGGSSTAVVGLTITSEYLAGDDQQVVYQNLALVVPAPGVLANDIPADPRRMAVLLQAPEHGSLELQADGGFKYTPQPDYLGTDRFTYQFFIGSGGGSNEATVSLTVVERPTARFRAEELMVNEYAGIITAALVLTPPHNGGEISLSFAPQSADCFRDHPDLDCQVQTQTIAPNQTGVEFAIPIFDDPTPEQELEEVLLTFTIQGDEPDFIEIEPDTLHLLIYDNDNHRPVAVADGYTTAAGLPLELAAPGVLANDYDPDAGLITLSAAVASAPGHGTLALQADGSLTYTPPPGFAGEDSFTYVVSDGFAWSQPALVRIQVDRRRLHLPLVLQTAGGN